MVNYNETSDEERSSPETPPKEVICVDDIHPRFTVALISRRSRHRAGTATNHSSAFIPLEQIGSDFNSFINSFRQLGRQFTNVLWIIRVVLIYSSSSSKGCDTNEEGWTQTVTWLTMWRQNS